MRKSDTTIKLLEKELKKTKSQISNAVKRLLTADEKYTKLTNGKYVTYITESGAEKIREHFGKKEVQQKPRNYNWMYKDLKVIRGSNGSGIAVQKISTSRQSF